MDGEIRLPACLVPERLLGSLAKEDTPAPIEEAIWYVAEEEGDGLTYHFPAGLLSKAGYLSADLLLDGIHLGVFRLILREGETGPAFHLDFGLLNRCSARMRAPLVAVNQNRWRFEREGAWLKPMCGGDRVDLAKVDRMTIAVLRKSDRPVRWCMTPVTASTDPPPLLEFPLLPDGPILDNLGQSAIHDWPGKTRDAEEVIQRLRGQRERAPRQAWPDSFSRFGGDRMLRVEATGFFRTHFDGRRWWLVDPDGHLFWSAGMDCVRVDTDAAIRGLETALAWLPEPDGPFAAALTRRGGSAPMVNYLAANFLRAFPRDDWRRAWSEIVLAELRRLGFNTVANWSEWEYARDAGFPYVRPLDARWRRSRTVFRDFPDVFAPEFEQDADDCAKSLLETLDDPAFIGYFLMNEPTWGFAQETPAAGMLFTTETCEARRMLAGFLKERHGGDEALSRAWGIGTTLAEIAEGIWTIPLTGSAIRDLADFSEKMVTRLFRGLSDACRKVDPNHLNLGARYYTVPPSWALEGMRSFDVFSMNCYDSRVPADRVARVTELLGIPVMVGEWHFGALDAGLPGSGIGHVRDQEARGKAYRVYLEDAASQPSCVGVHYFTLYDESAIGRFDGENWNIGFLDVCNRPYEPLAEAARRSHERMTRVASGDLPPYDDAPEYLPKLFL